MLPLSASQPSLVPDAVIHICSGRIVFVGTRSLHASFLKTSSSCSAPTLSLSPLDIILPAFLNLHTHAAMSLFKNLGNDRALNDWLSNFIFPLENSLVDAEFCRIGTVFSMAELLASGVSTFADMYFFQDTVAKEVSRVGMRAFLGESIIDFPQPDSPDPNTTLSIAESYIRNWSDHPLIHPFVGPHAPYTTSKDVYQRAVALNRKYGKLTWTHCSEAPTENVNMRVHQGLTENITVTQFLHDIGVLGKDLICAHSVWLTDEDVELYRKTGTNVAHCPTSNLKLASGVMRYSTLKKAGIHIGIGTDGHASNNDVDVVAETHLAALLHKGMDLDPTTMPALEALRHLTIEAAKAVGREKQQGSIEVGKMGDVVVFRGESLKWTPRFDVGSNGTEDGADAAAVVVYNANAGDVRGTVVDGKVLYWDSCYSTLDVDKVRKQAEEVAEKVRAFFAKDDQTQPQCKNGAQKAQCAS